MSDVRLSPEQLYIVEFCAKECELQRSGEKSVAWMITAWQYALDLDTGLTMYDVQTLGMLVEPTKNKRGLRQSGVQVGNSVKMDWQLVPTALAQLVENWREIDPERWFLEYEEIHPFIDGNGRTGQILYNWLRGSLGAPVFAPNYWADERRVGLPTSEAASWRISFSSLRGETEK